MAELEPTRPDRIADRAIIAGQFGPDLEIFGSDVIAKGDPEGSRVRAIRMIEVPAIVATQNPEPQIAVKRRISAQKALEALWHLAHLGVREHPVDAAVEPPNELPGSHRLGQEHADSVDRALSQLGIDHQHG
jgi:hypothetical protein